MSSKNSDGEDIRQTVALALISQGASKKEAKHYAEAAAGETVEDIIANALANRMADKRGGPWPTPKTRSPATPDHAEVEIIQPVTRDTVSRINTLHQELLGLARTSLEKALELGQLLSEAKASLEHGQWLPWLANNIRFSERTVQNYLRIYKNRDLLKSEGVADLSEAYAKLLPKEQESVYEAETSGFKSATFADLPKTALTKTMAEYRAVPETGKCFVDAFLRFFDPIPWSGSFRVKEEYATDSSLSAAVYAEEPLFGKLTVKETRYARLLIERFSNHFEEILYRMAEQGKLGDKSCFEKKFLGMTEPVTLERMNQPEEANFQLAQKAPN